LSSCFGAHIPAVVNVASPSVQRSVSGSISESETRSRTWLTNRRFEDLSYLAEVSLENSKDNSLLRKRSRASAPGVTRCFSEKPNRGLAKNCQHQGESIGARQTSEKTDREHVTMYSF